MKQETFAKDTSERNMIQWTKGLLTLFTGLVIAHLGVTMFLVSELGSDTFTILIQGISRTCGLSIGTCHVMSLIILMILMIVFTKGYIKPGSVICAFCGGWIIDFFLFIFGDSVSQASPFLLRIVVMAAGCIILALGMSVVIESNSGTGPNDLIAIILSDKINEKHNIEFRWVRMGCDITFVVLGVILGGTFGIGTLTAAFITGPLVQMFLPISRKVIKKLVKDI